MTSPFYTPIRVNQSDFSPITRGAEAYGRSIGAGLEKVGEALGKAANTYFKEKQYKDFAQDFVHTDAAVKLRKKKRA